MIKIDLNKIVAVGITALVMIFKLFVCLLLLLLFIIKAAGKT